MFTLTLVFTNTHDPRYTVRTENKAYSNAYDHPIANDDLDDDGPSAAASSNFQRGRDAYDNLVRHMLVAWDVLVGVAVGLWVVLRALHLHALRTLRVKAATATQAQASDVWVDTRWSAWDVRRRLLEAREEAFNEVAKPLEPYIFVFVIFAAPALVMSTTFCQTHSGVSAVRGAGAAGGAGGGDGGSSDFTYGTCDVWCEFVLAFRSLGTIAVYLVSRERRTELVAVRSTWLKLCVRVAGCIRCTPSPYARLDHSNDVEHYEMDERSEQQSADNSNDVNTGDLTAAVNTSSWRIDECDIVTLGLLGQGAFGEVWEGTLQPNSQQVAVKMLFAGSQVDEDGDLVYPRAVAEFGLECEALQRVDSPHLIKFFGFGITAEGIAFIVTELVSGGSLEYVLHDEYYDLLWATRVKIGLHVALGMEHIHKMRMLHRDLKSANVLLDDELGAKVCDFGLTRVIKPVRQHVVHSSYTGVTRVLSRVGDIEMNDGQSALGSTQRMSVSGVGTRGDTMTRAAGTLQWMAPEVFRGDQTYSNAVDVYSFGIVMWELATRETPWVRELRSEQTGIFDGLNSALQRGRRPAIPDAVLAEHAAFVAVMQRCWAGDPVDRPTFAVATRDLLAILEQLVV
jgi:hypothetical protein